MDYLTKAGISADYNVPLTREQVKRLGESRCRTIYNNIKATHNLVSVCNCHGKDFEIVDTDKYCYIMTYSFPCQDLSNSGLRQGMAKGSGTRSGLLWEVERLLDEMTDKPQILLMENVPQVIGSANIKHFAEWLKKLESIGYKNYWQVLNARDYGVPQNRERCFMMSIMGDYDYEFPVTKPLEKCLADLLEEDVDTKYYLKASQIKMFKTHAERKQAEGCGFKFEPTDGGGTQNVLARAPEVERTTILLSEQGTKIEKEIDVATALMARDYKGFGNQAMNAVLEIRKNENKSSNNSR